MVSCGKLVKIIFALSTCPDDNDYASQAFVWVVKRLTAVKEAFEGPFMMQGEWTWTVRGINGGSG
jgi:hypothetical protein